MTTRSFTPVADLSPGDRITVNGDVCTPKRLCIVVEIDQQGSVIYDAPPSADGRYPAHRGRVGNPTVSSGVLRVDQPQLELW